MSDRPGALVLSLDFELHWGVRDHAPASERVVRELIASRAAVTTLAQTFAQREVRATWATVGLLFATSGTEAGDLAPALRPAYHRAELDPYGEPIGATEEDDPLHLAGSLVDLIARTPGQEVGSHTFSHLYCLEHGVDVEMFRADLIAAQAAASARGLRLRSLVLPRNQWRPELGPVLAEAGFECYRGPQPGWANRSRRGDAAGLAVRAARLATTYAGPAVPTFGWDELVEPSGLCNIPASSFLRPLSPRTTPLQPLQDRRLASALRDAARRGRIVHLWWHPQNLVPHTRVNLERLQHLLDEFDRLREAEGMTSLSMSDVSGVARGQRHAA